MQGLRRARLLRLIKTGCLVAATQAAVSDKSMPIEGVRAEVIRSIEGIGVRRRELADARKALEQVLSVPEEESLKDVKKGFRDAYRKSVLLADRQIAKGLENCSATN